MSKKKTHELVNYTKKELLGAMYASATRLNNYMVDNNSEGVLEECRFQANIWDSFHSLQNTPPTR